MILNNWSKLDGSSDTSCFTNEVNEEYQFSVLGAAEGICVCTYMYLFRIIYLFIYFAIFNFLLYITGLWLLETSFYKVTFHVINYYKWQLVEHAMLYGAFEATICLSHHSVPFIKTMWDFFVLLGTTSDSDWLLWRLFITSIENY